MIDAFLQRVGRYRHDWGGLALDVCVGCGRLAQLAWKKRWRTRPSHWWVGPVGLVLLLALPVAGLASGFDRLGDPVVLAATLVAWPLLTELPGRPHRMRVAHPVPAAVSQDLPVVAFALLLLGEVLLAVGVTAAQPDVGAIGNGLLWGAAIGAWADLARAAVAMLLAYLPANGVYPSSDTFQLDGVLDISQLDAKEEAEIARVVRVADELRKLAGESDVVTTTARLDDGQYSFIVICEGDRVLVADEDLTVSYESLLPHQFRTALP